MFVGIWSLNSGSECLNSSNIWKLRPTSFMNRRNLRICGQRAEMRQALERQAARQVLKNCFHFLIHQYLRLLRGYVPKKYDANSNANAMRGIGVYLGNISYSYQTSCTVGVKTTDKGEEGYALHTHQIYGILNGNRSLPKFFKYQQNFFN